MAEQALIENEDRFSALDAFAREGEVRRGGEVVPVSPFSSPAERVFGAQQVAVMRDETRVLGKLKALAAAAGEEWYYRFPVRKKIKDEATGREVWGQDWIEGPSIKLANDLARVYGNCDVDIRVQDLGDSWLFYARFIDLETGFSMVRPFQQRKSQKAMNTDNARQLDIAFQIGTSKAIRNVVTNALQTFSDFAFEEARKALVGRIGKDLDAWRKKIAERASDYVDVRRIEATIGRTASEWLAPDIARIMAMMKAVNDGMASLDETFPPIGAAASDAPAKDAKADLDQFSEGKKSQKSEPNPAPQTNGSDGSTSAPQAQGAAASPSSEQSPPVSDGGDTPNTEVATETAEQRARRAGVDARNKGLTRKAVPAEFRQEPLLTAWLDGFDTGEVTDREPGEEG